jgi:hypothetical protein
MSMSRSRLFAVGVVTAGAGAAVALGNALPQLLGALTPVPAAIGETAPAQKAPPKAPDKGEKRDERGKAGEPKREARVEAPGAEVNVDDASGKVTVKAPQTDVRVDPEKGRVQVRAPYVDLDIRW